MEKKKLFVTLLGAGVVMAAPWHSSAQDNQAAQPAAADQQPAAEQAAPAQQQQEMPPQQVTDGGVEAVREAQEGAPAPVEKFQEARAVLKKQAKSRNWKEGYDPKKKRIIVIESADFKTADPASDTNFFIKREMAAKKAVLTAKTAIIQTINQDMSAIDLVNIPGTDVNKVLGAERERLNAQIARQKEILAKMLEEVDRTKAAELRGTTFGDRLNDLITAAIKKLDKKYDANARDKKAKAAYEAAKANFETAQRKYDELKEKAEAMQEKIRERQESAVASLAKMPLYGSSVIMQTESWNKRTGKYEVAVMLCWSYAMERAAQAVATGEKFTIKPSDSAKSVQDWLEGQNVAAMVGPRQYLDKDGNRWFLGITARAYDDELSSSARRRNKGLAEMFAQQMAAFCIWADVESYRIAKQALESRGNDKVQRDVVAESYAEKLTQSFKNRKVRGMQRLFSEEMKHPITGNTIYVVVYGISPNAAKAARAIEVINYATKVMDNRHQTVERGRDAANQAAVKASENRSEDFQKGYNQQSKSVNSELQKRQPVKRGGTNIINKSSDQPVQKRQSTSGTFGGDANVNDDF